MVVKRLLLSNIMNGAIFFIHLNIFSSMLFFLHWPKNHNTNLMHNKNSSWQGTSKYKRKNICPLWTTIIVGEEKMSLCGKWITLIFFGDLILTTSNIHPSWWMTRTYRIHIQLVSTASNKNEYLNSSKHTSIVLDLNGACNWPFVRTLS